LLEASPSPFFWGTLTLDMMDGKTLLIGLPPMGLNDFFFPPRERIEKKFTPFQTAGPLSSGKSTFCAFFGFFFLGAQSPFYPPPGRNPLKEIGK